MRMYCSRERRSFIPAPQAARLADPETTQSAAVCSIAVASVVRHRTSRSAFRRNTPKFVVAGWGKGCHHRTGVMPKDAPPARERSEHPLSDIVRAEGTATRGFAPWQHLQVLAFFAGYAKHHVYRRPEARK
ncbi:hypothetical protein MTO96_030791 [Rhipicephalus appendiculatus]